MGVRILSDSESGVATTLDKIPYATVGGNKEQPCLIIIWRASPEEKTSLQLRRSRSLLLVNTKRKAIVGRIQLFLAFFGPVIRLDGSAPAKSSARKPTAPEEPVNLLPAFH